MSIVSIHDTLLYSCRRAQNIATVRNLRPRLSLDCSLRSQTPCLLSCHRLQCHCPLHWPARQPRRMHLQASNRALARPTRRSEGFFYVAPLCSSHFLSNKKPSRLMFWRLRPWCTPRLLTQRPVRVRQQDLKWHQCAMQSILLYKIFYLIQYSCI